MIQLKKDVPKLHYYNQDFVDIYVRSWNMIDAHWKKVPHDGEIFLKSGSEFINQLEACLSVFYLVYSNKIYTAHTLLDAFYRRQEPSGAIRGIYSIKSQTPVTIENNEHSILPPLFAWAEFDLYHKVGVKKRVKEVLPVLQKYYEWIDSIAFDEEVGLYHVPIAATGFSSTCRAPAYYPIDFNCQQAMAAYYISELGDILNDKEVAFQYKKRYFMLKTRINSLMWDAQTGYYYDLLQDRTQLKVRTLAAYWSLLALIPSKENSHMLVQHLRETDGFATPNPFPSVAVSEPTFSENGLDHNGAVYPELTFMVIKGLEKYEQWELARESAIRHLYFILDGYNPEYGKRGHFWRAYMPMKEGPAWDESDAVSGKNEKDHLIYVALSTVTIMIENVVGLFISLPRKTVDWVVPTLELMGIENLQLKRNVISIIAIKNYRGSWELRLESEKLYYFTGNLLGIKKKTLPIPSGRCSMLLDKL
jgi:neutral trehalase